MMETRITSRKNPLIQQIRRLLTSKKERETSGLFVADGTKLLAEAVRYAEARYNHLRVDTHADNLPMQRAIAGCGFSYAGVIYLANGDPRRAFDRIQ
jgi:hypothetical protein